MFTEVEDPSRKTQKLTVVVMSRERTRGGPGRGAKQGKQAKENARCVCTRGSDAEKKKGE